jgi:hypothetical protein
MWILWLFLLYSKENKVVYGRSGLGSKNVFLLREVLSLALMTSFEVQTDDCLIRRTRYFAVWLVCFSATRRAFAFKNRWLLVLGLFTENTFTILLFFFSNIAYYTFWTGGGESQTMLELARNRGRILSTLDVQSEEWWIVSAGFLPTMFIPCTLICITIHSSGIVLFTFVSGGFFFSFRRATQRGILHTNV